MVTARRHARRTSLGTRARPRLGLTLVELLIGLALTSIMLGALASLVTVSLATWRRTLAVTDTTDEALAALDQITRDIRVAGYDPRRRDLRGVVRATPSRIALAADLDADGKINRRSKELITYRRSSGGDLMRVVGRQAMPMLSDLAADGLRLAYLDDQAQPINPRRRGALKDIRLVTVTLATSAVRKGERSRAAIRVTGGARILNRPPSAPGPPAPPGPP